MTSQRRPVRGMPGRTRFFEDGRGNGRERGPERPAVQVTRVVPLAHDAEITSQAHENGHTKSIDIESVMATWVNVCEGVRTDLREKEEKKGKHLYDPRLYQDWTFALALDLIHGTFDFDDKTPENEDMVWNYPEFIREVANRACAARLSPEEFMRRAFIPLLNHEDEAGSKAIDFLLGKEFLRQQHVKELYKELLQDRRRKTKPATKQEPDDPLELPRDLEKRSPA